MSDVKVSIRDNGPYIVRGSVEVTDSAGKTYEIQEVIALCRCGHSANKPFCDGSHNSNAFESAPRATTAAE